MTSIPAVKPLELSRDLGAPLHHQISSVLKDGIATGRHPPGEKLPSEDELGQLFAVSRITVRRALQSLEAQGLIERVRGHGTFVSRSASVMSLITPLDSFREQIADERRKSRPTVVDYAQVEPPSSVRSSLAMADGEQALRVVRVRRRGSLPLMQSTVYLPPWLAARFSRAEFNRTSLTELMEKHGVSYARIEVVSGAALADPVTAMRLQVPVGSALVDVRRVAFDQADRPIEYQNIVGPPDRYQLRVVIRN